MIRDNSINRLNASDKNSSYLSESETVRCKEMHRNKITDMPIDLQRIKVLLIIR